MTIQSREEYFSKTFTHHEATDESFTEVIFENCTFENCNFSNTKFHKCKFVDCLFISSNLSNIKIDYSKFFDVSFNDSKMVGIDWTKADWPRFAFTSPLKFSNSIINDSSFFGLSLNELELKYCKAQDVDFRNGNFSKGNINYTDFTNSLFMKTNLRETNFSDAENYTIDIFNNDIKGAIFSRLEALRLLDCLDIELLD
ncbi:MAG: hypothetical protein B0W54_01540 [Cellvibrio sp. 79]|nr:MAG: hypothetical protein B0W54_01540 [Cellvibrio sp. 79]